MNKLAKFSSSRKGIWFILITWIISVGLLSAAPSANDYKVNTGENDLPDDVQSVIANKKLSEYFPDNAGLLALLVFHNENIWDETNVTDIDAVSEWLDEKSELNTIESTVPFHLFPQPVKEQFASEDKTTDRKSVV